jgi:DUF1680 family protein
MKRAILLCVLSAAGFGLAAADVPPSVIQAGRFELAHVRLLDGPFKHAQDMDRQYLLSLDPERLLLMFRVTAGMASWARPLTGWESPGSELRGHTLGHYLSACSLMYASTGDPQLKARTDHIVAELAKCQAAMPAQGYHAGYLSAFPESFFDRVDAQQRVWAPWYTMHKIMAGLFDTYVQTGNEQALDVLNRLADWVKFRVDRLTPEQMQGSLKNEHGGMNEVLANLYGVTGNPDHLRLAQAFNHQAVFGPLARGEDALDGLHANTQFPKIIGAAREYELTHNDTYRDIARFFWQEVALKRSYAFGGDSDDEHFFPLDQFAKHVGAVTAETCNTYNMLKLTEHIWSWAPSAESMDFYERGLYNQILASQDPDTGMVCYFIPTQPGRFKTYSTPESSFWCCVGTGMENHAKYGEMIYAHSGDALYVNLFIPSEVSWPERVLTVRQETAFPDEPTTRLRFGLHEPSAFDLKVRQPAWAQPCITIRVNDQPVTTKVADGYVTVRREWRDGDTVTIGLPMALHTEALPGVPNVVAFLYGPIVLAGEFGPADLPPNGQEAVDQKDFVKLPVPAEPVLVDDVKDLVRHLESVAGAPLTFATKGLGRPADVTLKPFYEIHHQRYGIYWTVLSAADWQARPKPAASQN